MLQPETDKFKLFPLAPPRLTVSLFDATMGDTERGGFQVSKRLRVQDWRLNYSDISQIQLLAVLV